MAIRTETLISDYTNVLRCTTNWDEDMLYIDAGNLGRDHLEMGRVTLNRHAVVALHTYLSAFLAHWQEGNSLGEEITHGT